LGDRWLKKTKYDEGNKVHNNKNIQEYTIENTVVEREFENENNEIIQEEDEISVCTKEWRD
jgi:hypothetical protein